MGAKPWQISVEISEIFDETVNPTQQILDFATAKAKAGWATLGGGSKSLESNDYFVLGCDTIVLDPDGKPLGKPKGREHAFKMLQSLKGTWHKVQTAVSILNGNSDPVCAFVDESRVLMKSYSDSVIAHYIQSGSPFDKAGAYGIQDQVVQDQLVEKLEGSFFNVVGLPVERLEAALHKFGILESALCLRLDALSKELQGHRAQLLAVSKLHPFGKILTAYQWGQRWFGENYVQEWEQKSQHLSHLPDLKWSLIGPLQSNKATKVIGKIHRIESVHKWSLLEKLRNLALQTGCEQTVLLQVNLFGEDQKAGFELKAIEQIKQSGFLSFKPLRICGFMVLPPLDDGRDFCKEAAHLLQPYLQEIGPSALLSMGTSQDLRQALNAGSGQVRIGTALFGERVRKSPGDLAT